MHQGSGIGATLANPPISEPGLFHGAGLAETEARIPNASVSLPCSLRAYSSSGPPLKERGLPTEEMKAGWGLSGKGGEENNRAGPWGRIAIRPVCLELTCFPDHPTFCAKTGSPRQTGQVGTAAMKEGVGRFSGAGEVREEGTWSLSWGDRSAERPGHSPGGARALGVSKGSCAKAGHGPHRAIGP